MTRSPSDVRLAGLVEQVTAVLDRLQNLDARHAHAVEDLEARLSAWTALETDLRARTRALEDLSDVAARSTSRIRQAEKQVNSLAPSSTAEYRATAPDTSGLAVSGDVRRTSHPYDAPTQALTERIESLELAALVGREEWQRAIHRYEQPHGSLYLAVLGLAVAWLAALVLGLSWSRRFDARLADAGDRLVATERQVSSIGQSAQQHIASAQQTTVEQVTESQQAAQRARAVSEVLAASDLVQVHLRGGLRVPRAEAQLLWSPSRGLVLSGSGMPIPTDGRQHQLWLLTSGRPVPVTSFSPDAQGRVSWVGDQVPGVPGLVTGAAVTSELVAAPPIRSEASVRARAIVVSAPPADSASTFITSTEPAR